MNSTFITSHGSRRSSQYTFYDIYEKCSVSNRAQNINPQESVFQSDLKK